jgi:hypothetical protein
MLNAFPQVIYVVCNVQGFLPIVYLVVHLLISFLISYSMVAHMSLNVNSDFPVFDQLDAGKQNAVVYKLIHPKAPYKEIAKALNVQAQTLSVWRLETMAAHYRTEMSQVVLAKIESAALRAVDKLTEQLDSDKASIAQTAAIKLLEWHIGKPKQVTENLNQNLHAIAIVNTAMDVNAL